jgi:hypothetical protein
MGMHRQMSTRLPVDKQSIGNQLLPSFIELTSESEEEELFKQMAKNGGKVKKYKKDKSLGILCR